METKECGFIKVDFFLGKGQQPYTKAHFNQVLWSQERNVTAATIRLVVSSLFPMFRGKSATKVKSFKTSFSKISLGFEFCCKLKMTENVIEEVEKIL